MTPPPSDPAVAARLAQVDAATAARLAPTDAQRIQRALEVWELTGQPLRQALVQLARQGSWMNGLWANWEEHVFYRALRGGLDGQEFSGDLGEQALETGEVRSLQCGTGSHGVAAEAQQEVGGTLAHQVQGIAQTWSP